MSDDKRNILEYYSTEPDRMTQVRPMLRNSTPSYFRQSVSGCFTVVVRVAVVSVFIILFAVFWGWFRAKI